MEVPICFNDLVWEPLLWDLEISTQSIFCCPIGIDVNTFPASKIAEGGMETISDHLWLKWLYGYRIGFRDTYRHAGGFSCGGSPPPTPLTSLPPSAFYPAQILHL